MATKFIKKISKIILYFLGLFYYCFVNGIAQLALAVFIITRDQVTVFDLEMALINCFLAVVLAITHATTRICNEIKKVSNNGL